MDYPACFGTESRYAAWLKKWEHRWTRRSPSGFCHDCTPEYQREMVDAGRCAFPNVVFLEELDQYGEPEVRGFRPTEPRVEAA